MRFLSVRNTVGIGLGGIITILLLTSIILQNDVDGKDDYIAQRTHAEFKKPTDAQLVATGE